ncbi:MAG: L,D-transpeptidase family protein [Candidatus Omnitrophica bacterium]|nr:L,D-transpeptidase family protein [Candidatus Omnitrophota bacterium]MDD5236375.1 L,D-transpeptidase family protein [Candidatus Omnitrophota bacterium]MDD5611237.1 L,D-transpeptidase family protein [Candidatus Omnitrophota bacterium]
MKKKLFFAVGLIAVVFFGVILFKLAAKNFHKVSLVTSPQQGKLLKSAKAGEEKGDYASAKEAYQELIKEDPSSRNVADWQKHIEDLNMKLIFSPMVTAGSVEYEIQPGDTLTKIARQFNTTVELVAKINDLQAGGLKVGRKIKVWNMPFNVLVYKGQNILILRAGDDIIKTYIVSTGANNSTPVGTFKIVNKLPNPTWFKAGAVVPAGSPENILGTRWLGINVPGYGIHGTTKPEDLGKQVTQGCVRMANTDVEEIYMLLPSGTEVTIVN